MIFITYGQVPDCPGYNNWLVFVGGVFACDFGKREDAERYALIGRLSGNKRTNKPDGIYRSPVNKELLSIADEMKRIAEHRAHNNPQPDTLLSSWAGRIEAAIINGVTMESAMNSAIIKARNERCAKLDTREPHLRTM